MTLLPSVASRERQLAIEGFVERQLTAMTDNNWPEAHWLEQCVRELENMSDEEFAERYKDTED